MSAPRPPPSPLQVQVSPWRRAGQVGAIGLEMVIAVVMGVGVGAWADTRWGLQPWGTLVGLVVGAGAAARSVLRLVRGLQPAAGGPGGRVDDGSTRGRRPR